MIRFARQQDVPAIVRFIVELAEYERLADQCHPDPERLREHLFGADPVCEAMVAVTDDEAAEVVGFALFFTAYTTFETKPFLYLEDLYVSPSARGRGYGKALLQSLAALAVARRQPRVQWQVLHWNAPAIEFYENLGAKVLPDFQNCRVEGSALEKLAAGSMAGI